MVGVIVCVCAQHNRMGRPLIFDVIHTFIVLGGPSHRVICAFLKLMCAVLLLNDMLAPYGGNSAYARVCRYSVSVCLCGCAFDSIVGTRHWH